MDGISFKFKSMNSSAIEAKIGDKLFQGAMKGSVLVKNHIDNSTPVDTGKLQGGNQVETKREGPRITVRWYNETEYAKFVHDGTSRMIGNPFLWKGWFQGEQEFKNAINEG